MEEALKAGHVLEPDNGMQFCARVTEVDDTNSVNSNALRMIGLFACLECVLEDMSAGIVARRGSCCRSVMEKVPSCDNHTVFSKLLSASPAGCCLYPLYYRAARSIEGRMVCKVAGDALVKPEAWSPPDNE
jgi:hypothetical protein